ncbi:hypothetical protein V8F20_004974 [Naviculisporaceae sp. PSN 640]
MALRLIWTAFFALVSIAATIASLIGGMNPGIKDLGLYRLNVTLFANSLQEVVASTNKSNTANLNLGLSHLPTYWWWGMSGLCDIYIDAQADISPNKCHAQFPVTKDLLTIVTESLTGLNNITEKETKSIISSWETILATIPSSMIADKHPKYVSNIQASAGIAILSIIINVAVPVGVFFLDKQNRRTWLLPLVPGFVMILAGVLATQSMYNSPKDAVDTGEHGGGGIIILFVGAALSLGSALFVNIYFNFGARKISRWRAEHGTLSNVEIGFIGERHVHWYFTKYIPDWTFENWTSSLRERKYPPFTGLEKDHSDFTYIDTDGTMGKFLTKKARSLGLSKNVLQRWTSSPRPVTYHFEVKSTPYDCDSPFYVSENQVQSMEKYDNSTTDAYLVLRVYYSLADTPRMRLFSDPWSRIQANQWVMGPLGADGPDSGFSVHIRL